MNADARERAPRNRIIGVKEGETGRYGGRLVKIDKPVSLGDVLNRDRGRGVLEGAENGLEKSGGDDEGVGGRLGKR